MCLDYNVIWATCARSPHPKFTDWEGGDTPIDLEGATMRKREAKENTTKNKGLGKKPTKLTRPPRQSCQQKYQSGKATMPQRIKDT